MCTWCKEMCSHHGILWQMMACLFFGTLILTAVITPIDSLCTVEGEREDGYNPEYCYAFRPSFIAETDSKSKCCAVSNRIENPGLDAPDHLKEYIEIAETETNFTRNLRTGGSQGSQEPPAKSENINQ